MTSFICLGFQDWIPRWLSVLVVSRDVFIVGGLVLLNYSGVDVKRGLKPVLISKCATLAQISLVLLIMVEHSMQAFLPDVRFGLVCTVAVLTALSGGYYLVIGLRMFPLNENGHSRP